MDIALKEQNGIQIIELSGKVMGDPTDIRISETIDRFIEQDKLNVILDISKLVWMNSHGLGMCLSGLIRLRNRGGDLKIVGLTGVVESLMKKCRILPLFSCYKNVEQALNSF